MSIYPDQKPNADVLKERSANEIFNHIEALCKNLMYVVGHEQPRREAYERLLDIWKKAEHEALAEVAHTALVHYWLQLRSNERLPEHRGDAVPPEGLM